MDAKLVVDDGAVISRQTHACGTVEVVTRGAEATREVEQFVVTLHLQPRQRFGQREPRQFWRLQQAPGESHAIEKHLAITRIFEVIGLNDRIGKRIRGTDLGVASTVWAVLPHAAGHARVGIQHASKALAVARR